MFPFNKAFSWASGGWKVTPLPLFNVVYVAIFYPRSLCSLLTDSRLSKQGGYRCSAYGHMIQTSGGEFG